MYILQEATAKLKCVRLYWYICVCMFARADSNREAQRHGQASVHPLGLLEGEMCWILFMLELLNVSNQVMWIISETSSFQISCHDDTCIFSSGRWQQFKRNLKIECKSPQSSACFKKLSELASQPQNRHAWHPRGMCASERSADWCLARCQLWRGALLSALVVSTLWVSCH